MGKRGPKRQPGKRWANGDLVQTPSAIEARREAAFSAEQVDAMAVAIEARKRLWNLDADTARDAMAGDVVGRMRIAGQLSKAQHAASVTYRRQYADYQRARESPKQPGAVDLNRARGLVNVDEDTWTKWASRARARHEAARQAVTEAQTHIGNAGNLWGAMEVFLSRDVYVPSLEGDLKLALNALSRHYGLVGDDE